MLMSLVFILLAAAWRVVAAHIPALLNFAPLMALTFCGAVYFRDKRLWLVPFAALLLSDLYLDHYYQVKYSNLGLAERDYPVAVFRDGAADRPLGGSAQVVAYPPGRDARGLDSILSRHEYRCGIRDPAYFKTAAGWWQAMTIGRPEYPPTLYFFRNTFVSDLMFTGIFAFAMELAASRAGRPVSRATCEPNRRPLDRRRAQSGCALSSFGMETERSKTAPIRTNSYNKSAASSASFERSPLVSFTCAASPGPSSGCGNRRGRCCGHRHTGCRSAPGRRSGRSSCPRRCG